MRWNAGPSSGARVRAAAARATDAAAAAKHKEEKAGLEERLAAEKQFADFGCNVATAFR